jgi:hypothetical protein
VILDSAPRVAWGKRLNHLIVELDRLLAAGRHDAMDRQTFADKTAEFIGPTKLDDEFTHRYEQMEAQLLEPARAAMTDNVLNGLQKALDQWRQWIEGFGRRRGSKLDKLVLDVLSYEFRAAFHEAYSEVWFDLVEHLSAEHGWSRSTRLFHVIWHTQRRYPAQQENRGDFHLFHGHVLALHPATDLFLLTRTGLELVSEAMEPSDDPSRFEPALYRLLNDLYLATYFYVERRKEDSDYRKQRPQALSDIDESECKRKGRRRRRRRS